MKKTTRREILKYGLGSALALPFIRPTGSPIFAAEELPKASWNKLPRWRGFNLLEKFMVPWNNKPFVENDFKWISEFGFDFVRLPMDYRSWIIDGDWRKFNEKTLSEIDDAIEYGLKYKIHVLLNFHRAPGYTVANPSEAKSVWTDPEALEVCTLHWSKFAKRYKGIPNERLSFNLFNEPANVPLEQFMKVHRTIIAGIRAEAPGRLIICDGNNWGSNPVIELAELKVAQASRGYAPSEISHYKAEWANGDQYKNPQWPSSTVNGNIFSPGKREVPAESRRPLRIDGPFAAATKVRLHVESVSSKSKLIALADEKKIFEHQFDPGPGEGEWKKVVHRPEWNTYQNVYDRDYDFEVPAGTKKLEIALESGDWVSLSEIGFSTKNGKETCVTAIPMWNQPSSQIRIDADGEGFKVTGGIRKDRQWLKETMIEPWKKAEKAGCGIMIGEFGAYNKTPHDVVLAWLEDSLANWKEAGWGFALWNFRGSFGILDSDRADVAYENFRGHKLDRKMLELLQKY